MSLYYYVLVALRLLLAVESGHKGKAKACVRAA